MRIAFFCDWKLSSNFRYMKTAQLVLVIGVLVEERPKRAPGRMGALPYKTDLSSMSGSFWLIENFLEPEASLSRRH